MDFLSNINLDLYLRLFVAMSLGMLIGTERIIAHKTAGVRTYTLVTMGAALFAIISQLIYKMYPAIPTSAVHIPSAVITGVGFLGTGLMVWRDDKLLGITSAAGLWISAGIGLACGMGFYQIAVVATLLTLFVFIVLWYIEQKIKKVAGYIDTDTIKTDTRKNY